MRAVTGAAEEPDGGVPHGALLRRFAVAVLDGGQGLEDVRSTCLATLGESATIQAASVVASFDGINRVADATGIRLDPETVAAGGDHLTKELGLGHLASARS
ncbi:MAG: hypothetical protein CL910_12055 [Deltaproteobacteria bacterium]|nr:hypothetical protein [Deltaproteobacteria bacterium]